MISRTLSEEEILTLKHFKEEHIEKNIYRTPQMREDYSDDTCIYNYFYQKRTY